MKLKTQILSALLFLLAFVLPAIATHSHSPYTCIATQGVDYWCKSTWCNWDSGWAMEEHIYVDKDLNGSDSWTYDLDEWDSGLNHVTDEFNHSPRTDTIRTIHVYSEWRDGTLVTQLHEFGSWGCLKANYPGCSGFYIKFDGEGHLMSSTNAPECSVGTVPAFTGAAQYMNGYGIISYDPAGQNLLDTVHHWWISGN
jgi:hypothetical protein